HRSGIGEPLRQVGEDAQSTRRGNEVHEIQVGRGIHRANESARETLVQTDRASEPGRPRTRAGYGLEHGSERATEIATGRLDLVHQTIADLSGQDGHVGSFPVDAWPFAEGGFCRHRCIFIILPALSMAALAPSVISSPARCAARPSPTVS